MPRDDTSPIPEMTTRLCTSAGVLLLALGVRLDVVDGFLDARDLFRGLVRNLDSELLLECHDQLNGVERVSSEVVDEGRFGRHFLLVHPELFHDDALHLVCDSHRYLLQVRTRCSGDVPAGA